MPNSFSAAQLDDWKTLGIHEVADDQRPQVILVAVLDGANEHASVHGVERAAAKEAIHRNICKSAIVESDGELCQELLRRFGDAAFGTFFGPDAVKQAVGAALSIHRELAIRNLEHQLAWEDQVHSRVVVANSSWEEASGLMPQAMRGNVVVQMELWQELQEFATVLACVSVRCASQFEQWEEVSLELEEGIELPEQELHVGRRSAHYQAKFSANRAALAAATVKRAAVG